MVRGPQVVKRADEEDDLLAIRPPQFSVRQGGIRGSLRLDIRFTVGSRSLSERFPSSNRVWRDGEIRIMLLGIVRSDGSQESYDDRG
jgi:hypothetical protein